MLEVLNIRQKIIINFLKDNQFASVQKLKVLVNYSESTIKRDLAELEKLGLIRRTGGGAIIIDNGKVDPPYLTKIPQLNQDSNRNYLANVAETLIKDEMSIIIDSSSTCLYLVQFLSKFKNLKIMTNGILTAALLSENTEAEISIIGGSIVHKRATINGAKAYNDVLNYNADIAFVSCRGFDLSYGATEIHEGEALIKKAFRKQADRIAVLVSSEKMNQKYMYQSLGNSDIDYLLTEEKIFDNQISHHVKLLN